MWCIGSNWRIRPDNKYEAVATVDPEDFPLRNLLKKKVRCPICNRRLQPKTHFNPFAFEYHAITIPRHKPK